MYNIEKKSYGFKLTFGGFIKAEEMKKWVEESQKALLNAPREFGVLIDMRTLKPLPPDSQAEIEKGQKLYKDRGMQRSAVILSSSTTKLQFQRIAKETGIYQWERYIDASAVPNWESVGENWIIKGIDPDK